MTALFWLSHIVEKEVIMSQGRDFPFNSSPYWMESAFEIRQILKTFAKRSEKITVANGLGKFFVTVVLDVTDRGDLILDASADPSLNAIATSEVELQVHGVLDRVDMDFKISKGKIVGYDGAPALLFALPERLHRLQRREYFRIPTPMVKPLMCSLYVEVTEGDEKRIKEYLAPVLDISIGGLCLQEPKDVKLEPGDFFKSCSLLIPEIGVLRFDLSIRHAFDVENRLGKTSRRAGCEFINMPAAGQQSVQKFMTKLERDRRSILS